MDVVQVGEVLYVQSATATFEISTSKGVAEAAPSPRS